MSKRIPAQLECPECNHQFSINLYRSIWVEEPENRKLITENLINRFSCPKCDFLVHVDYAFFATNVKKGFAIWYEPYPDEQIDKDVKDYIKHMGANSFYALAPRVSDWETFKRKLIELENKPFDTQQAAKLSNEMLQHMMNATKSISQNSFSLSKAIPEIAAIILLLWALLPINPYGFYVFMRFIICGVTCYLAVKAHDKNNDSWMYILGGLALLYNPVVRIHLDRELWSIINIITIFLIARFSWMSQKTTI